MHIAYIYMQGVINSSTFLPQSIALREGGFILSYCANFIILIILLEDFLNFEISQTGADSNLIRLM